MELYAARTGVAKTIPVNAPAVLLALRNSRPENWMDLQHRGQSRRAGRGADRSLIGGASSVAHD